MTHSSRLRSFGRRCWILRPDMLAYFPQIYPGELLYSVLARYHLHTGETSPIRTMQTLFGRRMAIASIDLPGSLDVLAARLPPGRSLDVDRMLGDLTLLPYYISCQSPAVVRRTWRALRQGDVESVHMSLGLAAFRVGRVAQLRFCPICLDAMHRRHGEWYWRRDHQLPGVLVCPEHRSPLRLSRVTLPGRSRHAFIAADEHSCPAEAPALVPTLTGDELERLGQIAQASAGLLEGPHSPRSSSKWAEHYRRQMQRVGLAHSARRMKQHELHEGMRQYYGRCLQWLPRVMDEARFTGDWLPSMVRRRRKAAHPLHHVLLQCFLMARHDEKSPFGVGPWPCKNPLHHTRAKSCVRDLSIHRNHGHTVGVFTCSCGYVYTRMVTDGSMDPGPARFQAFGPLLEPVLRRWLDQGYGLRDISRRLALDPKTVVRLAMALELRIPWSAPRKIRSVPDKSKVVHTPRSESSPHRSKPASKTCARRDWEELDKALSGRLGTAAAAVRRRIPPTRVSMAAIERELGLHGWIGKRRAKLPVTTARLSRVAESIEAFQHRRLSWVLENFEAQDRPLIPSAVLRAAGLPTRRLEMVRTAITQRATRRGTSR